MLPLGIASAPLDLLNAAPTDAARGHVHVVPSRSARTAPRRLPETAVAAHATHATTCHVDVLGPEAFVLARVLQTGTDLELRIVGAGTEDAPPTTFAFPAPILASVGVFLEAHASHLHVLLVTKAGSLYRVQMPLATLLRGTPLPHNWAHEHRIDALTAHDHAEATSLHAVDAGLVLVACADGTLLQLKQSISEHGAFVGAWRETSLRPASFFSGVSRLFHRGVAASPGKQGVRAAPTQTLAVASHVRENDAALAFCVCRDRKLRVWNLVTDTCVRTVDLPVSFQAVARAEMQEEGADVFEPTSAPHIQLFYPEDEDAYALYLLLFVPAPLPHGAFVAAYGVELEESNSWAGGVGDIALVWGKSCDARTQGADVELRDMALTRDAAAWRVWLLWHAGSAPLLQHTLALGADPSNDDVKALARAGPLPGDAWTSIHPFAHHAPLRGPGFDAALAQAQTSEDVAQFFLQRLVAPARFSSATLAAALRAHTPLGETESRELAHPQHRTRLVEAMLATVGAARHAAAPHLESTRTAWLRFARLVEQIDRNARWPLCLTVHDTQRAPYIVAGYAIGAVVQKDATTWLAQLAFTLASAAAFADRAVARAQGEAASADFAAVVNTLVAAPVPDSPAFSTVREHSASLLQTATYAAELHRALGTDTQRWLPAALCATIAAPDDVSLYARLAHRVPPAALERIVRYVDEHGADTLVRHVAALVALACSPLAVPTPAAATHTLHAALGAEVVAEVVGTRARLLEALAVLHAMLLHNRAIAALDTSLRHTLRAWQHAAALRALVVHTGLPEHARTSVHALVPMQGLRLDAARTGRPAVHLLHAMALAGVVVCHVDAATPLASLRLALGAEPLPTEGTAAPLPVLALGRALLQHGYPAGVCALLRPYGEESAAAYLVAMAETYLGQGAAGLARLPRIAGVLASELDERVRLLHVLPSTIAEMAGPAQRIAFYTHAAAYWEAIGDVPGALACYTYACDALRAAPAVLSEPDARQLWSHVFRAQLSLAQYDASTATLLALPYADLREVCLHALITALCEAGLFSVLLRLHFLALQPRVEQVLRFQARNADPLSEPNYFHVLHAYHTTHGDHKNAAAAMYQLARRLHHAALAASATDVQASRAIAVLEAQSYLAAINALALLPATHAWFAHAADEPQAHDGHVTSYLPSDVGVHAHALAVVQLADVRRTYNALLARLELMRLYPELANPTAALRAEDAVNLFLAADDLDAAIHAAHRLDVALDNVFDALTRKCVALERAHRARPSIAALAPPEEALAQLVASDEEAADADAAFLRHSPRAASWPGPAHERAWRFLQMHLGIADAGRHGVAYRTTAASCLLALDAWPLCPAWLSHWFTAKAPDALLRVMMRQGALAAALDFSVHVVEAAQSAARTSDPIPAAWLPYPLFDALLSASGAQEQDAARALRTALALRTDTLGARRDQVEVRAAPALS